ncbi:cell division protein ZipA C-terminal FtsZ-binding domain-containing protein [Pararobbsia alpina]|uniref:Cell division protein ZipA n=1 Tax=Pararobbsia alpina TaxID=621374 RepID=A0A6S7BL31_9BURK|nr:cell division protein ZipA C-terminal FtsZ-binding domain-containing protein [Pararobbsia alpina]CAB3794903.1 Cell division protein ZipA [Pararobbsia alpina]
MNELQLGLIGAGAVIVIGVVLYNAWQGARVRRRMPRSMPMPPEVADPVRAPDVSDESPFIEPNYGSTPPKMPAASSVAASGAPGAYGAQTYREPAAGAAPIDERREPTLGGGDTFSEMDPAAVSGADIPGAAAMADLAREADEAHEAEVSAGDAGSPATRATGLGRGAAAGADTGQLNSMSAGAPDSDAKAGVPGGSSRDGTASSTTPVQPPVQPAVQPNTQTISAAPPTWVDHRIDCVVLLRVPAPVTGDKILPLAQRIRRAGSKPVFIEGLRESDGGWEALQPGARYSDLRAAVQLANRSGALNELEFSEFVTGVQALADGLDAEPEFPDMMETVAMARELDAFAAQCDAQLSINILSDGAPWSANYVQAVASQDGLLLSRDGTRFVKLDAKQNPVFMLQFGETNFLRDDLTFKGGQMITLLLDVPVADEDILPFRLMCDYAASLSHRIGARVVDDQRRPLPETALAAIENQLLTLYAKLEHAGITAGSPAARRLFSS